MVQRKRFFYHLVKLILFAQLGVIMFISYVLMQWAPNIHLLGVLTVAYTVAFRSYALVPIYVYVFANGLYAGFNMWWIPYLYIWTLLWAATMLLPKNMKPKTARIVYSAVCVLHGLLFGILYAPAQAFMFGLNFKQTLIWIAQGFTFDILHAVSNAALGLLIFPISQFLTEINEKYLKY